MAAARLCFVFIFLNCFLQAILALDNVGESHGEHPLTHLKIEYSANSPSIQEESAQTSEQVSRRSLNTPPIKKATAANEKKTIPKFSPTEHPLQSQTGNAELKVENTTAALNASDVETLTTDAKSLKIKSNVTTETSDSTTMSYSTSPLSSTSVATSSSSSTTTSSTVTTVTPISDVLPTRPSSVTNTSVDHHVYYNSTKYLAKEEALAFWVEFDTLPQDKFVVHRMLSDSHRKAATVTLSFDFPFYGHPLRNITIATGGFVYMGDYMHSWLAATQYIAPLMANFDTSLSNESMVRYYDNGTAFVIEWHAVTLQDSGVKSDCDFTFQTTLLKNGDIVFVYKVIPVPVTYIGDDAHPVKVGLSDAYVIDKVIYFIRRKTIYEYHRIDMKKEEISNGTAIYFNALTTCMKFRDCRSCMASENYLHCVWCEASKRCSDGLDRLRQDWLHSKCDVEKESINCSLYPDVNPYVQPLTDSPYKPITLYPRPAKPDSSESSTSPYNNGKNDNGASTSARVSEESGSVGVGSVVAILLFLACVMGGLVWVGYAYRNPHTSSGQLLIRYRPTTWRFRSGEARYTAASVHM